MKEYELASTRFHSFEPTSIANTTSLQIWCKTPRTNRNQSITRSSTYICIYIYIHNYTYIYIYIHIMYTLSLSYGLHYTYELLQLLLLQSLLVLSMLLLHDREVVSSNTKNRDRKDTRSVRRCPYYCCSRYCCCCCCCCCCCSYCCSC